MTGALHGFLVAVLVLGVSPLARSAEAPAITQDLPEGFTALESCTVTFSVEAQGTPPLSFQWFKDDEPIPDATSATYVTEALLADNGASFYVIVSNAYGNARSRSSTLIILLDNSPPTVTGARTGNNLDEVVVTFSAGSCGNASGMDAVTASDPYNYSFGEALEIFAAQFIPPATVVLTTSPQTLGAVYTVTVEGVMDQHGNVVAPTTVSFTTSTALTPAPPFQWARHVPGGDDDGGYGLALDAAGNCYLTTHLRTNAILGGVTLPGAGILVAAYHGSGNVLGAFKGSSAGGFSEGLALDRDGNIFVAGAFFGNTTFGSIQLINTRPYDGIGFLAKYRPNGSVLWAKAVPDVTSRAAKAIAVDPAGNVYVTGVSGPTFVAKYDPQGDEVWVQSATGTNYGASIAVDKDTNCIVSGWFWYGARFGNVTLTSRGDIGAFLAKYDPNGNVLWARAEGGDFLWNNIYAVAVDQNGNIYATGYYSGTGAFGSAATPALADMFVAKYDPAGHRLWVRTGGGRFNDIGHAIAVDAAGSCYVAGMFQGAASFGPFVFAAGAENYEEAFVLKLDTNGEWLWAKQAGGVYDDYGYAAAINPNGNCFVAGYFRSPAKFDLHTLTTDNERGDSFIAAIAPHQPALEIVRDADNLQISWPQWASHLRLETGNTVHSWQPATVTTEITGGRVRTNVTAQGAQRFFRLAPP